MKDPFAILGVDEEADDDAVRAAYLRQVRNCPPDRDAERFQEVRQAYESIADVRSRLGVRLFHAPKPDLVALMAPVLREGVSVPPSEKNMLALLSESVRAFHWPTERGES
ncbi:MAG: J domain-containing protein [Magnetococcales bacterium]|nr:J domain-containing protein [Magnetococcales bacterium]